MTVPEVQMNAFTAHYWSALADGRLEFQRCLACGHKWLPARENCPGCLGSEHEWMTSNGRGTLISWVVYHKAYAPHLEACIPYNVAIVELAEGPRLITNIVERQTGDGLHEGAEVELSIEEDFGLHLPRFRLRIT